MNPFKDPPPPPQTKKTVSLRDGAPHNLHMLVDKIGMCWHGFGILPRIRNEQAATGIQKGAPPAN